jgi:hypothetical protein
VALAAPDKAYVYGIGLPPLSPCDSLLVSRWVPFRWHLCVVLSARALPLGARSTFLMQQTLASIHARTIASLVRHKLMLSYHPVSLQH